MLAVLSMRPSNATVAVLVAASSSLPVKLGVGGRGQVSPAVHIYLQASRARRAKPEGWALHGAAQWAGGASRCLCTAPALVLRRPCLWRGVPPGEALRRPAPSHVMFFQTKLFMVRPPKSSTEESCTTTVLHTACLSQSYCALVRRACFMVQRGMMHVHPGRFNSTQQCCSHICHDSPLVNSQAVCVGVVHPIQSQHYLDGCRLIYICR